MKLRSKSFTNKKIIKLNRDGVFSDEILMVSSIEDRWRATIRTAESYIETPSSLTPEVLDSIVNYFGEEAKGVPSALYDFMNMMSATQEELTDLLSQFDKNDLKDVAKIVDIGRIKSLTDLISDNKVMRYAANSSVLLKIMSIMQERNKQLSDVLEQSYKNGLVEYKVLKSLHDIGIIYIEDEETNNNHGKTTSFITKNKPTSKLNLNGASSDNEEDNHDRIAKKGLNAALGNSYRTGGLFDKRNPKGGLFNKKTW